MIDHVMRSMRKLLEEETPEMILDPRRADSVTHQSMFTSVRLQIFKVFIVNHIFVVNCIWQYMNCSGDDADTLCRSEFRECSDDLVTDADQQWKGVEDVPGLNLDSLDGEEGL